MWFWVLLVALGGAAGSVTRFLVSVWFSNNAWNDHFPWATFAINVGGSFLLGVFASLFLEPANVVRREWYLLLGTGFCGGFTTFSTFSLETFQLMRSGRLAAAGLYAAGSVVAGLLGVWLAVRLTGR